MPKPNGREKLIVAGLDTLHRRGFNGCGVQDIVDTAGVPKGSFYNHFASKEQLGLAALERYWHGADARLRFLTDTRMRPGERLRRYFDSLAETFARWNYAKGCLIGNFSAELADQSAAMRERISAIMAQWSSAIAVCIREAQQAGEVRADLDPDAVAAFLLNSWQGAVLRAKVDKNPAALNQFRAMIFPCIFA